MFTVEIKTRNLDSQKGFKKEVTDRKIFDDLVQKIMDTYPDIKEDYNLLMADTPSVSLDLYQNEQPYAMPGTPIDIGNLKVFPFSDELFELITEALQ